MKRLGALAGRSKSSEPERESASAGVLFDVAIVGAGVAGLSARTVLKSNGLNTVLLEKSRGLGGRLSTRRGEGWRADLGAQYASGRVKALRDALTARQAREVWLKDDAEHPRYALPDGMSALARELAQAQAEGAAPEDVRLETRVARFAPEGGASDVWRVHLEDGSSLLARAAIVTAPAPQALELLEKSGLSLEKGELSEARALVYSTCLTAIVETPAPLAERLPAVWKNPTPRLSGVYDQLRKGVRGERPTLVIHASPDWSAELWHRPDEAAAAAIAAEAERALARQGAALRTLSQTLHRWRYAQPERVSNHLFLFTRCGGPALFLAGDAFGGPSVEGAFQSGEAAGARAVQVVRAQLREDEGARGGGAK